uniref:Uncharacterized protein n=1 Tax=Kalanchoe fedtschenkoi TaxID=63787 RepID=A0A7N0V7M3_KALFE
MAEEDEDQIRKGPWKAEEDEVLINHVSKYGPRDWSSIRSKGLLRRTGKSCRLRWVNKLRPNLKNGCKFSAEEERVVIEMQAEIGNKWATIATYLPGRTDNDVKNFWSSRQKRLARMRQASCSSATPPPPPPPSSENKCNGGHENLYADEDVIPSLEVPECGVEAEEMGASTCTFRPDQCPTLFSAYISHEPESLKMVELPALMMMSSGPLSCEGAEAEGATGMAAPMITATERASELGMAPFPPLHDDSLPIMTQPVLPFPAEELLGPAMEEPSFMDIFGESGDDVMFGEESESGIMSCNSNVVPENGGPPVTFFDDFPSDMLDQMESLDRLDDSLPSPSQW